MKMLIPLSLLLLGACTSLGPNYEQPQLAGTQSNWVEPTQTGAIDPVWWLQFNDPLLSGLIEQAMEDAPSLAQARARLAEARANRAEVVGGEIPQINANGSARENRISENGQFPVANIPGFPTEFSLFDLGFDASWELDLWGKRGRALEVTDAQIAAAQAGRDAALVQLSAEIARNYMDLRLAQADHANAKAKMEAEGEVARLAQMLADAGEGNAIDAQLAAAQYEANSAQLALAQSRAANAAYRIGALLGEPPEALSAQLLIPAQIPQVPEAILAGVRSDLLRRRPDVRQAERQLAAATAEIGFRTADLFPSFSLNGGIGLQSRSAGGLFESGSVRYGIGPSISWPIFSGGRIRAQIAAVDARADGAAAAYEGAVMNALADSEGAANRWLTSRAVLASAQASRARVDSAFALSQLRFERGEDSRFNLEQARLMRIASQQVEAQARGQNAQAAIALFKALGGAWMADDLAIAETPSQ